MPARPGSFWTPSLVAPPMAEPPRPFDEQLSARARATLSWADWMAGVLLLPALCLWSMGTLLPIEFLWSSQAAQQLERWMR